MLGNPVFVAMDREKMGAAAKSQVRHALATSCLEKSCVPMLCDPHVPWAVSLGNITSPSRWGPAVHVQAGFLEFLVMPLFQAWSDYTTDSCGLDYLKANIAHWKEMDQLGEFMPYVSGKAPAQVVGPRRLHPPCWTHGSCALGFWCQVFPSRGRTSSCRCLPTGRRERGVAACRARKC
jgi:hypothetical protein